MWLLLLWNLVDVKKEIVEEKKEPGTRVYVYGIGLGESTLKEEAAKYGPLVSVTKEDKKKWGICHYDLVDKVFILL